MEKGCVEEPEWDDRCRQCGKCCFEKIENDSGAIFYTQTACRFLDLITRQCKIFERRFEINPECIKLTEELLQTLKWLPLDCGYRERPIQSTPKTSKRKNQQPKY